MKNNLIALHGRMGSGKDTVAKIIQILTLFPQMKTENVVKEIVKNKEFSNHIFEVKKFADKLKDIVCILIGCSRKDLEDRDFKEKPLPEEWWVYKIESPYGTSIVTSEEQAEEKYGGYYKSTLIKTTARLLLQSIGTECFRDIIHPDTWVLSLFADYKERYPKKGPTETSLNDYVFTCEDCGERSFGYKKQYICNTCHDQRNWFPNWVISDMRFENEFEAVKKRGGICITIQRGEIPKEEHSSEKALDGRNDWDYVINNNGSLEELVEKVREILREAL